MKNRYVFVKLFLIISLSLLLFACENLQGKKDDDINLDYEGKKVGKILEFENKASPIDFNKNGNDDYKDFLIGAKKDAANKPVYDGTYVDGGYPTDDIGVCTDVIWRAFKKAGYSLKDMIDKDIARFPEDYSYIEKPDKNIDFRRVPNQHVFFKKYAVELTTDLEKKEEWSAGDIVIFKDDYHIGIISDKRNDKGTPYVLHNMGQNERDEDFMSGFDIIGKKHP